MSSSPSSPASQTRSLWPDVALFFALACAITWLLELSLVLAYLRGETPPEHALPLAGLGAFGPTLAALLVAARRHELRGVFGRWRCNPLWVVLALFTPGLLHLIATLIEVALGGSPSQWFYPPDRPEFVAALVVFSVGEEFGWRGFAYPRLTLLHGPVVGSLVLGFMWGVWHLAMSVTPQGTFDPLAFAIATVELMLASVVFAWMFEQGNRSMAVAFAFHAGAHLDNVTRGPESEVRLRVLRFLMWVVAAVVAGWALSRSRRARV